MKIFLTGIICVLGGAALGNLNAENQKRPVHLNFDYINVDYEEERVTLPLEEFQLLVERNK